MQCFIDRCLSFSHYVICPLNNINLKLYVSTIDNFAEIGNDSGHVLDLDNTTLKN